MRAGEISGAHVDLVASCNRPWRNADFVDSEEFLVNLCRTPFFSVAQRGIEYWKQRPISPPPTVTPTPCGRAAICPPRSAGAANVVIDGVLDPVGGEIFKTELDRLCEQLRLRGSA